MFRTQSLLAGFPSAGPAVSPTLIGPGFLVPVGVVTDGSSPFGYPGASLPSGFVSVAQVVSVDVAGPADPETTFRIRNGQGGEVGIYRFRVTGAWEVTIPCVTVGTKGRLVAFLRILDDAGAVLLDLAPGGVGGSIQNLDIAGTHVDSFEPVELTPGQLTMLPGYLIELGFRMEIITPGAALDTATWVLDNGQGGNGPTAVEIDGGGLG